MNHSKAGLREERSKQVAELRADGKLYREIAETLGISMSYVHDLLVDPTGERMRARKESYRRPCPECGTLMDGSNGRGARAPKLCAACAAANDHEERFWTSERIVAAFRKFYRVTGRAPAATDVQGLTPSYRKKLSPERVAEVRASKETVVLPGTVPVYREFGSWGAGLEAAGLKSRPSGGSSHRAKRRVKSPKRDELLRFLRDAGRPVAVRELKTITPTPSLVLRRDRESGTVTVTPSGRTAYYEIAA